MNYNSVAEIYDDIDAKRASLLRAVEGLSDEQQSFRTSPDRWSAAEIVEHLSMVEASVARLLASLLGKAEAAGSAREGGAAFAPVSVAEFVERSRGQKYNAPERARPTGAPLAESVARLRETRAAVHNLRPRFDGVDGTAVRFPHPAFGPLDLYQWLAFIGLHDARHLAQINALKEAMGAER
ncbi:MAG TPA: DinB family protein [Pyrinomonadaceae bacterium]|nr:DinB family protein [Pyrinomonadaceae bacterium]